MNNFNVNVDVYLNRFNIHLLNEKYEDEKLSLIVKNDGNLIHQENFTLSFQYYYYYGINLDILDNVILEIKHVENQIYTEEFKFKFNYGQIKMPVIRISNPMGFGDYMMITPIMKKLHSIYKQRVSLILPNINSQHNNNTNIFFTEFIQSNPDLNILFNWDNFLDADNKYEIYNVFDNNWNAYYYFDLKQKCAFDCGFSLTEKELETIYYPYEFKKIDLPEKYVCINTGTRGPERSWEKEKWQQLVDELNEAGIYVVSIGRDSGEPIKPYNNLNIKLGLDLCGDPTQNSLSQTWHIINKSDIFITFDTGLYLFAGTTDTHILMLGWCGDPYYHQSYRNGSKYYKFSTVRGECSEYCLTDPKWDLMEHGDVKTRHIAPRCELGIDFRCKPTVEQAFNEVKLILFKML